MTKETGCGGLDKPPLGEETYQTLVGQLPGLLETINGLVRAEETVGPLGPPVGFGEGGLDGDGRELREDKRQERF